MTPDYWTAADQAELDRLVWAFVGAALEHRARCPRCDGRWCPGLVDAFRAVVEWRQGRQLASRAAWLRDLQTAYETAGAQA